MARKVRWQNRDAELELKLPALREPVAFRSCPAVCACADRVRWTDAHRWPNCAASTRKDRVWEVELVPLTRGMQAWSWCL